MHPILHSVEATSALLSLLAIFQEPFIFNFVFIFESYFNLSAAIAAWQRVS